MQSKIAKTLLAQIEPRVRPFEINDTELPGFLVRVQPTGGMSYMCAYRLKPSGKRDRVTLGRHPVVTPQQARDEAKKILGDVARGIDPKQAHRDQRRQASKPTLGEFLQKSYAPWAEHNLVDGRQTVSRVARSFAEALAQKLDDLTSWQFEKWKLQRQKLRLKPATINRELAALRAVLSKAVDWNAVEAHPMQQVKQLKNADDKRVRYLSDAEELQLRSALDQRERNIRAGRMRFNDWRRARGMAVLPTIGLENFADHLAPIVLMALNTGLRRGELFSLTWGDIEWAASSPRLKVRAAAAKSRRPRYIPLNSEAQQVLMRWRRQNSSENASPIFPGQNGKARLNNINRSWNGLLSLADLKEFHFHDLRHHFASRLVMSGVDLNTIRELLGHADIKMTLRYAHLAPEHKAAAVEKIVRVA